MEVTVTDYQNLPENSMVSVRFGATRRQAPLGTAKEHPLKFPSSLEDVREPLKIDVLQPIASARLVLHEFSQTYRVGFDDLINDESQGGPLFPKDIAIGLNVAPSGKSRPIRGDASAQQASTPFKFQDAAASAREYLESHGLLRYVQALLHAVIQVRPDDPFEFMIKQLSAPQGRARPASAPAKPKETVPRPIPKAPEPEKSLDPCKESAEQEPTWGTPASNVMPPPEPRATLPPVKPPARKEPPRASTPEEADTAAEEERPKASAPPQIAAPPPVVAPVRVESREDAVARLKVEMGGENAVRVCVIGSAQFQGLKSQELTRLIGKALNAQTGLNADVRYVTGGMPGVQETLAKELTDVNQVCNLVPFASESSFEHGRTCYGGMDLQERREIYSLVGDIYLLIEGGPSSASEIRSAHARGAFVVPVPRTGGAARGMFDLPQELLSRPGYASEEEWALLSDAEAPIERTAEAASALLLRLIDDCRPPTSDERIALHGAASETLVEGALDGRLEDILRTVWAKRSAEEAAQPDVVPSTTADIFNALDADRDGVISREEFAAALHGDGNEARPATGAGASEPRPLAAADAPAAEAAPVAQPDVVPSTTGDIFNALDADKDGVISREELAAALHGDGNEARPATGAGASEPRPLAAADAPAAGEPRPPAAADVPAVEATLGTCVLPAISAAPVPTESPEEAAARLKREMGRGGAVRVCIVGSPIFRGGDTQQLAWLIGKALDEQLPKRDVVYVTGGMPGVQETLVKAVKDGSQVYNLVPYGHDCSYGHGRTCYGGRTLHERKEIFGLVGDIYLLVEGGPAAAAEATRAHARGARVVPVPRSGCRKGMPPEALQKPDCIPADTWALLSDTEVPCELTAGAVASALRVFVAQGVAASAQLALRREMSQTLVEGAVDGRLPSVLETIQSQKADAAEPAGPAPARVPALALGAAAANPASAPSTDPEPSPRTEATARAADVDALIGLYKRKAIETLAGATSDGRLQAALGQFEQTADIDASPPPPRLAPPESVGVAATDDHHAATGTSVGSPVSAPPEPATAASSADARTVSAVKRKIRALLEEAACSGELANTVTIALLGPEQAPPPEPQAAQAAPPVPEGRPWDAEGPEAEEAECERVLSVQEKSIPRPPDALRDAAAAQAGGDSPVPPTDDPDAEDAEWAAMMSMKEPDAPAAHATDDSEADEFAPEEEPECEATPAGEDGEAAEAEYAALMSQEEANTPAPAAADDAEAAEAAELKRLCQNSLKALRDGGANGQLKTALQALITRRATQAASAAQPDAAPSATDDIFKAMDADGDGVISRKEFAAVLHGEAPAAEPAEPEAESTEPLAPEVPGAESKLPQAAEIPAAEAKEAPPAEPTAPPAPEAPAAGSNAPEAKEAPAAESSGPAALQVPAAAAAEAPVAEDLILAAKSLLRSKLIELETNGRLEHILAGVINSSAAVPSPGASVDPELKMRLRETLTDAERTGTLQKLLADSTPHASALSPGDEKEEADSTQDIHTTKNRLRQLLEYTSTNGHLADVLEGVMKEQEQTSIKELKGRTRGLFAQALESGALETNLREISESIAGQAAVQAAVDEVDASHALAPAPEPEPAPASEQEPAPASEPVPAPFAPLTSEPVLAPKAPPVPEQQQKEEANSNGHFADVLEGALKEQEQPSIEELHARTRSLFEEALESGALEAHLRKRSGSIAGQAAVQTVVGEVEASRASAPALAAEPEPAPASEQEPALAFEAVPAPVTPFASEPAPAPKAPPAPEQQQQQQQPKAADSANLDDLRMKLRSGFIAHAKSGCLDTIFQELLGVPADITKELEAEVLPPAEEQPRLGALTRDDAAAAETAPPTEATLPVEAAPEPAPPVEAPAAEAPFPAEAAPEPAPPVEAPAAEATAEDPAEAPAVVAAPETAAAEAAPEPCAEGEAAPAAQGPRDAALDLFAQWDTDGDGYISREEFEEAMRKQAASSSEPAAASSSSALPSAVAGPPLPAKRTPSESSRSSGSYTMPKDISEMYGKMLRQIKNIKGDNKQLNATISTLATDMEALKQSSSAILKKIDGEDQSLAAPGAGGSPCPPGACV